MIETAFHAQLEGEIVIHPDFVGIDVLNQPGLSSELHQARVAGDQLALVAKRHQMRFPHETDFQPHLRRLDNRGEYAAGITLSKLGCHSECSKCNARHAVRIDVLWQGTGNFTLELFQHGRETFRLLSIGGRSAIDVFQGLQ